MGTTLLILGFLLGMRHATEADHLAAMATIASRSNDFRSTALQGAAWGIGHTVTLLIFGGVALLIGGMIPDNYAHLLEFAVGLMLVGLGVDVLRQLFRKRIHFHEHSHNDGVRHFHAHTHETATGHDENTHNHRHEKYLPRRALFVGLMHGMAGSAALIVITAEKTVNLSSALVYILIFGLGSIIGMAMLSVAIMLPMRKLQQCRLPRYYKTAQYGVGLFSIFLGVWVCQENLFMLGM